MKKLRRPSPALVVAIVALVVAMGGTGYAALKLPKNSVGHAQLKKSAVTSVNVRDRSLLARDFRPGQLPSGRGGTTGKTGARGPRGHTGARGPAGPPGPTAVAASQLGDPPAGTGAFSTIASTTISTTVAGRLLVEGHVPGASAGCSAACSLSYELYVDGSAIPKSDYTISGGSPGIGGAVVVAGIRDAVPAGAHTVELRSASSGSPTGVAQGGAQVQALLAG